MKLARKLHIFKAGKQFLKYIKERGDEILSLFCVGAQNKMNLIFCKRYYIRKIGVLHVSLVFRISKRAAFRIFLSKRIYKKEDFECLVKKGFAIISNLI